MTNWDKYASTPEKLSELRIDGVYDNEELLDGVAVWHGDDILGIFWNQYGISFLEWLQEECE